MALRALDLFCGAGGASEGLAQAGFEVTGMDIRRRRSYPFSFIEGDATLADVIVDLQWFDFIWASPPCQAHTMMKTMHNAKPHVDLIPATRELLMASGKPWVIENVY